MLKIFKNPDTEAYKSVMAEVKANDGFCPCRLEKTPDTKCPCKEFRQSTEEGECHCGAYIKKEVGNEVVF